MKVINIGTSPKPAGNNSSKKSGQKFSLFHLRAWWHDLSWTKIFSWIFRIAAVGVLLIAFLFIYYSRVLPDPNRLLGRNVPESTKIYARDESLLYEVHGEFKRTLVNLDQISPHLKDATLAAEDRTFYSHSGVSFRGLARSLYVDIISGQKKQGGSTITQQFVKNAMLTNEKSILRKIKEIILSIELEARFSKDDIFKMYLNEIPYGRNAYGIEAASQTYFNKHANELTIAESAYLAALPQAPSYYNPSGAHFDALVGRQRYILGQMKELKTITEQEYQEAMDEKVVFEKITNSIKAAHFVQYVQDYLADKYGEQTLQEGGLKVYTTLDPKLQEIAEKAVADGAAKNVKFNGHNAALVAMDPKTGQILAMVGSKDYFGENYPKDCTPKTCLFSPNVNVATTLQQPGSSFKPYAYVTAFGKEFKYSPASMLVDVKTDFGGYSPNNFNLAQNGPVSIRKALAGSLNIPAVKIIGLVGADKVTETARSLGINSKFTDCGLSLVLGGCDVTLIDHTAAYSVFAAKGVRHEKTSIMKVVSKEGEVLEEYKDKSETVLDEQAVYELTSILSDNSARAWVFGSGSALQLGDRPVAAKTGTTQDFRDGWTMGYTPSLVAGVWTGNNNNVSMKTDAVAMAGPIWQQFMKGALAGTPIEQFEKPDGIKTITVDAVSGKLPTEHTPETKSEIFADYAVPTTYDDVHIPVKIDMLTGQPATELTPPDQITTEVYNVLHSEKPKNPSWENPVIAWALANGYKYPPGSGIENTDTGGNINITSPADGAVITKVPVPINLTVKGNNISRIDILVDGTVEQSLTTSPYKAGLTKKHSDGTHTISAKVVYSDGTSSTDSVTVTYALNGSLKMSISGGGGDFPLDLSAESSIKLNGVTFWYSSGGSATEIGTGDVSNLGNNYVYSLTWDSPPASGTYNVYAKSNSGIVSDKISIKVP